MINLIVWIIFSHFNGTYENVHVLTVDKECVLKTETVSNMSSISSNHFIPIRYGKGITMFNSNSQSLPEFKFVSFDLYFDDRIDLDVVRSQVEKANTLLAYMMTGVQINIQSYIGVHLSSMLDYYDNGDSNRILFYTEEIVDPLDGHMALGLQTNDTSGDEIIGIRFLQHTTISDVYVADPRILVHELGHFFELDDAEDDCSNFMFDELNATMGFSSYQNIMYINDLSLCHSINNETFYFKSVFPYSIESFCTDCDFPMFNIHNGQIQIDESVALRVIDLLNYQVYDKMSDEGMFVKISKYEKLEKINSDILEYKNSLIENRGFGYLHVLENETDWGAEMIKSKLNSRRAKDYENWKKSN